MPYADPEAGRVAAARRYRERRGEILAARIADRRASGIGTHAEAMARRRNPNKAQEHAAWLVEYYRSAGFLEAHRNNQANRRGREAGQFVEHVDRKTVWERDLGICHLCQEVADPVNWHLEHIVALANGGEHSYANTAVSHPRCNLSKGTKSVPSAKSNNTP